MVGADALHNGHFRTLAEHVRHGILEAGGYTPAFPVLSLGETRLPPTAMPYRNLASMDVEEGLRANPLDGTVLLMVCDKTTPALLMGAASVNLPTIGVSGGPMLNGHYRGQKIGSGTNTIPMSEQLRAGEVTLREFHEAEAGMSRSTGHCMTVGNASTMVSVVGALGVACPATRRSPRWTRAARRAGHDHHRRRAGRGAGPAGALRRNVGLTSP